MNLSRMLGEGCCQGGGQKLGDEKQTLGREKRQTLVLPTSLIASLPPLAPQEPPQPPRSLCVSALKRLLFREGTRSVSLTGASGALLLQLNFVVASFQRLLGMNCFFCLLSSKWLLLILYFISLTYGKAVYSSQSQKSEENPILWKGIYH